MSASLQLSSAQYGIWLGQQLNLESSVYNTAEFVEIVGALQEEAFKQAVYLALEEAQALRVKIVKQADNSPGQQVQSLTDWSLAIIDFTAQSDPQQVAEQWMSNNIKEAVDVSVGPLYYSVLLKLGSNQYYWYQRIHHAVIDGYGFSLIIKRVADLYTAIVNQVSPVSKPLGCLADVIEEDLAYRNSSRYEKDKLFWQQEMASLSSVATFSSNTASISQDFIRCEASIEPSLVNKAEILAKQLKVSWLDILVATFAVLINQYRNQFDDIVIGLPVMNRLGSSAIRVPCMQMNIIPLRIQFNVNDSFSDVVIKVSEKICLSKKHPKYRYEDMKRDLGLLGGDKRLFGPVINIMPFDTNLNFGGCKGETNNLTAGPVEDISFGVLAPGQGRSMHFNIDANPACYNEEAIQGLSQDYLALITRLIESPELTVCNELHSIRLLNGGESLAANTTVIQLITYVVKQFGDKTAVVHENVRLTYNELNDYAYFIASLVVSNTTNDNKNPLIAILLPRSIDAIGSILGVLMVGAGYLPLDPEWPALRINEVLEDAQPDLVITYSCYQEKLTGNVGKTLFLNQYIQAQSPTNNSTEVVQRLVSKIEQGSMAYVIYTSGSTGKPNGVAVSHRALANFVAAAVQSYGVDNKDSILQFAPLQFDASVEEIFLAFCTGGTLVLRTDDMLNSIPQLLSECTKHKITVLDLPTAYWHELTLAIAKDNLPPTLKTVIIGGEAALPERLARWQSHVGNKIKLLNTYGPTEATVVATFADISKINPDNQALSIGKPLPGVQAVILDSQLQPTVNEGELYLLGSNLANGYLNRPELNQRRFINLNSLPGYPKAYRTGDRVKLNENDELVYLGRIDDEFKISGYRVNPAEIENILIKQSSIQDAAVVGQVLTNGSKRLIAFVVQHPPLSLTSEEIRQILLQEMPPAVVPSAIELVSQLPKTTSGKIDRKMLQSFYHTDESVQNITITATPLEKTILNIWSGVLGQTALSPQDDFFKIGGQSLQTIQVANRLGLELQQTVAVEDIFKYPVAADLAAILSNNNSNNNTTNKEAMLELGDHILEEEYVAKHLNELAINSYPKKILLTGVTGFVGAQLLHKLLKNTSAEIYCLVRANNKQQAWARIKTALTQQQLAVNESETRVIPIVSDLSKPLLGLEEQEFNWLASQCDAIYHNAAVVSIVRDYSSLREVNVLATKELLKLAASNRVVPFHHISTQAVAAPQSIMDELPETFINHHAGLIDGYQQSKWAAENLVQQAGERGLPVSVYRLGRVTGAMETGYVNKQDFFWRIIHASIPIKAIPQINVEEVWTPVDFVAEAVSRISLMQTSGSKVFNVALDKKVLLPKLFQWLEQFGYQLTSLPLPDWKTQVKKYSNDEDLAIVAFFDMRSSSSSNQSTEKRVANKVANKQFKIEIEKTKLKQPAISKKQFFNYLEFAIKNELILSPKL